MDFILVQIVANMSVSANAGELNISMTRAASLRSLSISLRIVLTSNGPHI